MIRPMVLLFVAATLGGCAFGQKHDYLHARPTLNYTGKARLALAVHDQRPYVVSQDKDADFVGLSRGVTAIPSTCPRHPGTLWRTTWPACWPRPWADPAPK